MLRAREGAMRQGSSHSTHPIVQHVRTVEQANQAFDAITYSKGNRSLQCSRGSPDPTSGSAAFSPTSEARLPEYQDQRSLGSNGGRWSNRPWTIARDFTDQPGVPLIEVGAAQCVSGKTLATLTQSQFSNDERAEVAQKPSSWHVPVRASAGAGSTQVVTDGPVTRLTVEGCGPLLINVGQTGYYRTLYQPENTRALVRAFPSLPPVDQFGLMSDQLALSQAGYQGMAVGLDFLGGVSSTSNAKLIAAALDHWSDLYDDLETDISARAAISKRVIAVFSPKLEALGFTPKAGEAATDALLRSSVIETLGKVNDSRVLAQSRALFVAWQTNPNAIPGSLKATWLRSSPETPTKRPGTPSTNRREQRRGLPSGRRFISFLAQRHDEALARRALDLALSNEPGKTTSAGMITAAANSIRGWRSISSSLISPR